MRLKSVLPSAVKALLALSFIFLSSPYSFGAQLKLAWDANAESDLAGYKVYYGTSSRAYGTPISVGNVTTYTLSGLTAGQTYFVSVTAVDTASNESGYSNEISGAATNPNPTFTVATNPTGLQIVVDSVTYTSPQTFNWAVGSSHSLSVPSPQGGVTGTRYVYASWSDGGAQSHTITAPSSSTTYTANFTTQYSLTTTVSPSGGGTVTPSGTNWYNSGQSVSVSATASSGYTFSSWSGNLSGSTNPASLTMNGVKAVTANFNSVPETITAPNTPSGPTSGTTGTSYSFSTGGSSSNLGHSVQYRFDWGDGTYSSWSSSTSASKTWSSAASYSVKAQARCATDTSVVSAWSSYALSVTISTPTLSYTVTTSPGGLQITVDGTTYTAPNTFIWAVGSTHTIAVSSPQNGSLGTRYIFSSWSDSGAQSHTITAPSSSTTYTANFTTQYSLTTTVSPSGGGTVTPSGTNWYNSGQSVSVSATASSGYTFSSWTGDLSGNTNPASLTMNGLKAVTANFAPVSETITTPNIPSGPTTGTPGTSYSFSTGGSSSNLGHSVQYQFDWGDGTYSGWSSSTSASKTWSSASSYSVKAQARCATDTSVVSAWSSGLSVTITAPTLSHIVTTSPAGRQITVDGTPYTAPNTFTWAVGSTHTIAVSSPQNGSSGTRYVFSSWSDSGAQSHTITAPSSSTTYTANFTTQYTLTTAVNPSGGGTVSPSGTNWYNSGQSVSVSATASSGYTFSSWSGDLSGSTNPASLTMNGPKSVTANFSSVVETITTPNTPSGPTSGTPGTSYSFSTGGSSSNLGHSVQYRFDWGDGTYSSWSSSTSASKTWSSAASYSVKAQARCATDTSVVSAWSSYALSVTITAATLSYTVTTSPAGRQITVDSTSYTAPNTFIWAVGSTHTIAVSSPQNGSSGTRYVFSSWSDSGAQSHTITAPSSSTTYTANFTTQYTLTTAVNPSGGGTVSPSGTNWYNSGQSVSVSATASSGYTFSSWSGNLSGSTNPASLTMNGLKTVTANFNSVSETISTPAAPSGPSSGNTGVSYSYIASGASSNLGDPLDYQFDWKGDGTDLSLWGAANQQTSWSAVGTYNVRVRARCSIHTSVVSNWSAGTAVVIQGVSQISCPDSGIQCVARTDGGADSNNLVNGKPKVDLAYDFNVVVQDSGGTPQYVKLWMTQRSNPQATDFYDYDMSCSGNYTTGANCTYRTKLGPAAVHKFYFTAKMSGGMTLTYPSTGYITGPQIQLLTGDSQVGIPRDLGSATLSGQQALGSSRVYRWQTNTQLYTKVTSQNPVKDGEGYSLYKQNKALPELANYPEVSGAEFTYQIKPGLNLITNPYSGNVRLADVKIQKGTQPPVSWQAAATNGWIVNALYYYNGKDWGNTYSHETLEDGAVLVPWLGYLVNLNSADASYYLIIPKP